jgi:hypothetical protein
MQQNAADLLRQLETPSPTAAPPPGPPSAESLLAQLEGSTGPEKPPPPPKKTPQQQVKDMDEDMGWAHLFAVSIAKGLTSPMSMFLSDDLKDMEDKTLAQARANLARRPSTFRAADMIRNTMAGVADLLPTAPGEMIRIASKQIQPDAVVGAAETGATMAGSAVSSIPFQKAGSALAGLTKVGAAEGPAIISATKGMTLSSRTLRELTANTVAGGGMSAFAHLEPGQSRAAMVAQNATIAGATALITAPLFLRSWKDELGVAASNKMQTTLADTLGVHPKVAQGMLTELRAGSNRDTRVAEAVVKAAADDPGLKNTPLVLQAQKRLESVFGKLLPQEPPIVGNPHLYNTDPNYGLQLVATINGQRFPLSIRSVKGDTTAQFGQAAIRLRARLVELSEQGADIKLGEFNAHSVGTWNRFRNIMFGKDAKGNIVLDPKDLPGSAPTGSISELGTTPPAGTRVRIVDANGNPTREGKIAGEGTNTLTTTLPTTLPNPAPTPRIPTSERSPAELEKIFQSGLPARVVNPSVVNPEPATVDVLEPLPGRGLPKTPAVKAPLPTGTVPVETATGTIEHVPRERLMYVVDVNRKPDTGIVLAPHPDGSERRFLVYNQQNALAVEASGATADNNIYRNEFFEKVDPEADLGHAVRGFVHPDGSVTLSVPQVQRIQTPTQFGQRLEGGPIDSVEVRQHSPKFSEGYAGATDKPTLERRRVGQPVYGPPNPSGKPLETSLGPKATARLVRVVQEEGDPVRRNKWTGEVTGGEGSSVTHAAVTSPKVELTYNNPLSFGAGYVPKKMRDEQYAAPLWAGSKDKVATPITLETREIPRQASEIQLVKVDGEITAQARTQGKGLTHIDTPQYRIPSSTAKNPSLVQPRSLYLDQATKDIPELISARDTARIMLKKGIDPSTKVRVRASEYSHTANDLVQPEWTLRELSQFEPHMVPLDALRKEASDKGFIFIPQGKGGILRDQVAGVEKYFDYQLEAAEHLGRIHLSDVGPKLESPLETSWKMGWYRSFDPDVDSSQFSGVDAQDLAMQELIGGKRPLVHVWTSKPEALTETIRAVEKQAGLPEGTFAMSDLSTEKVGFGANGGKPVAVYNPTAVKQVYNQIRPGLEATGLSADTPAEFVSKLQDLPNGLDVLKGRDPESALVYSFLRKNRMKDEWELGKLQEDSLGRFRVYDPQMKQALFSRIMGAAKDFDPTDHSLEDYIHWPEDVEFAPHSTFEPGNAEPMDLAGGGSSIPPTDVPSPGTSLVPPPKRSGEDFPAWFLPKLQIPNEIFKKIEAASGVPFWTSWRNLQHAKADVEGALASPYTILNQWKNQYTKSEREQAQLLFETRMAGKDTADFVRGSKTPTRLIKSADELEQAYRTFLGDLGVTDHDMREFFAEFPQLRKNNGDFKTWIGGRQGLPKMFRTLQRDFLSGDIRITDRETDGFVLGRRLMRMMAQEKYMMPTWDKVSAVMEAYAKMETSVPPDLFKLFETHLNSIRYMPDEHAIAITRSINKMFKTLGMESVKPEHITDYVSFATGLNYAANMAWRTGLVLRNLLQTVQTTFPVAGPGYTAKAFSYAVKWLKDPKLQEEMIDRGVIPRDALSQTFGDIQDFILSTKSGNAGLMRKGIVSFLQKGTTLFKYTDDFNRVLAYQAQYMRAMDKGADFLEGKMDFGTFVRRSKLDLQDEKNGPVIGAVNRLLNEEKNLPAAAHEIADNFHRFTQFQYSRENAMTILQSTPGRLFGQYGTWSGGYFHYLKSINPVIGGRGSFSNRLLTTSQWVAANAAMYYTAKEVFGVDLSRWLFFSPMDYQGGPAVQMLKQGAAAVSMGLKGDIDYGRTAQSFDPTGDKFGPQIIGNKRGMSDLTTKLDAGRFLKTMGTQFIPGMGAARDINNALKEEEFGEAIKRLLNLPSTKPEAQPGGTFK